MTTKTTINKIGKEAEVHTVTNGRYDYEGLLNLSDERDSTFVGHFDDSMLRVSGEKLYIRSTGSIEIEQVGGRVSFTPSAKMTHPEFIDIVVERIQPQE